MTRDRLQAQLSAAVVIRWLRRSAYSDSSQTIMQTDSGKRQLMVGDPRRLACGLARLVSRKATAPNAQSGGVGAWKYCTGREVLYVQGEVGCRYAEPEQSPRCAGGGSISQLFEE